MSDTDVAAASSIEPLTDGANADYDWDAFEPVSYKLHNYADLREDDREILHHVRDFFARHGGADRRGVDVGAGPNLYPALSMLPFCSHVDLIDWSQENVDWLQGQIDGYDASWDQFWIELAKSPAYAEVSDPRARFKQVARSEVVNLYTMDSSRRWDMGTMFFVAESSTTKRDEFEAAVRAFVAVLNPGAPFAAAFMQGRNGYRVGDQTFPSLAIDDQDVADSFQALGTRAEVHPVHRVEGLDGRYDGMIVVTGTAPENA